MGLLRSDKRLDGARIRLACWDSPRRRLAARQALGLDSEEKGLSPTPLASLPLRLLARLIGTVVPSG
jgi:hypothetical protein